MIETKKSMEEEQLDAEPIKRSIPSVGICNACTTIGLFNEECEECGRVCDMLHPKLQLDEVAEELMEFGECYRCDEVGMFAAKCN